MAMTMNYCFREGIIYASLEALVPETHFVRKLDRCIDWRFIYSRVAHLYSPAGRPSIDPVILFKMLCINIVFGFNSMRRTCRECDMKGRGQRTAVYTGVERDLSAEKGNDRAGICRQ